MQFESASKAGCTPPSVVKKKSVISSLSRLRRSSKKNKVKWSARNGIAIEWVGLLCLLCVHIGECNS